MVELRHFKQLILTRIDLRMLLSSTVFSYLLNNVKENLEEMDKLQPSYDLLTVKIISSITAQKPHMDPGP